MTRYGAWRHLGMLIAVSSIWSLPVSADEPNRTSQGTEVALDGLHSRAPVDWAPQRTGSHMRLYQFRIVHAPGDREDAEVTVFFFGPGSGGSAADNVKRWKGMFIPPNGENADDIAKVEHFRVGDADVTSVDIQGTYRFKARPFDPNSPETPKPNYRMVAVAFECNGGPYFLRMLGPAKTVAQHKQEFDDWVKGFK